MDDIPLSTLAVTLVVLLLIVVAMDAALSLAERRLLRWRPRASAGLAA